MERDETKEPALKGRAAVRALLIEPLQTDGLQRSKGVTLQAHQAYLDRLQAKLSYLSPDQLAMLRDVVLRLAEGPLRNCWPAFVTVWNNALRICEPPDDESHIAQSWLASVEGPRALAGGYLVELHTELRKAGRPLTSYEMAAVRTRAAENARRALRVAEWVAAGRTAGPDAEWLDAYRRRGTYCRAIVEAGQAARDAKQNVQTGDAA